MRYTISEMGISLCIKVIGELSIFFKDGIEKDLTEELAKGRKIFVFDFSEVTYLDSSGLSLILMVANFTKNSNNLPVLVIKPSEHARFLLERNRCKGYIEIIENENDALNYINTKENSIENYIIKKELSLK